MTQENVLTINNACPALGSTGLGTWVYAKDKEVGGAPLIPGKYYYVHPKAGNTNNDGLTKDTPLKSIIDAYTRCIDGDGIVLLSAGNTTTETTSYLKKTLTWDKNGITVFGICAPVSMYQRARISNTEVTTTSSVIAQAVNAITRETGSFVTDGWVTGMTGTIADSGVNNGATFTVIAVNPLSMTVAETLTVQTKAQVGSCVLKSYVTDLIHVTGANNRFINIHVWNSGSSVLSTGALKVSGVRNAFSACHFGGAGNDTPAASVDAHDVHLSGCQEASFYGCTLGTDTVAREAANGNILVDGGVWRTQFYGCTILAKSVTAGKGAIKSGGATSWSGYLLFKGCSFLKWNENGITSCDSVFIGTKPTSGALLVDNCAVAGWTAWDSVADNNMVFVANSAAVASGGGGIATTP